MKLPEYNYSRTTAQEECRERFRRAQEMMIEEFKSPERQQYWQQRAKRENYKTAKGCCKAHYYRKIVDMDLDEEWKQSNEAMRERREAIERGETGEKEFNKVRTFWYRAKAYITPQEERDAGGESVRHRGPTDYHHTDHHRTNGMTRLMTKEKVHPSKPQMYFHHTPQGQMIE